MRTDPSHRALRRRSRAWRSCRRRKQTATTRMPRQPAPVAQQQLQQEAPRLLRRPPPLLQSRLVRLLRPSRSWRPVLPLCVRGSVALPRWPPRAPRWMLHGCGWARALIPPSCVSTRPRRDRRRSSPPTIPSRLTHSTARGLARTPTRSGSSLVPTLLQRPLHSPRPVPPPRSSMATTLAKPLPPRLSPPPLPRVWTSCPTPRATGGCARLWAPRSATSTRAWTPRWR